MFDDVQPRQPSAGPVPPPPLDPDQLRSRGTGAPMQPGNFQQPQAPQAPQGQEKKDWGPWKPKKADAYNPPDTPQEIQQVLSQYAPNPGQAPVSPKSPGSGKRWLVIVIVVVLALAAGTGVFAFMKYQSAKQKNTNIATTNANSNVNGVTNKNANLNKNSNTNLSNSSSNSLANSALTNILTNTITNSLTNSTTNTNSSNINSSNTNSNGSTNTNTSAASETLDSDVDGLPDAYEAYLGTNAKNADSDGDGFPDGVELYNGYSPKGPSKLSIADYDSYCLAMAIGGSYFTNWTSADRIAFCDQLHTTAQTMLTDVQAKEREKLSALYSSEVTTMQSWCSLRFPQDTNINATADPRASRCVNSVTPNLAYFFQMKELFSSIK